MSEKYRLPVRLYRQYDLDLIALLTQTDILPLFIKGCLKLYATGKKEFFLMPQIETFPKEEEIHNSYNITLYFDMKEDAQTITLLDKVRPGYKNGFIKNVVRSYMYGGYCAYYFDDPLDTQNYFEQMQSMQAGVLSYDKFKEMRPDKIPDQILRNTALQLHGENDEKLEVQSTSKIKEIKEEKETKLSKKTKEKEIKKEKPEEKPLSEKEEPIVFPMEDTYDSDDSSAAEPIIVEINEEEQQELEDMFASMMTDF